jgi:hypothetical protein
MAARSTLDNKIMDALKAWESSKDDPAKISEIAGELGAAEAEVFNALGRLEDAGKVTGNGRGLTSVWFLGKAAETATETPVKAKRTRRTKAQMETAREEERMRREYAVRVTESTEPGSQHRHPMEDARPESSVVATDYVAVMSTEGVKPLPAETPVVAENGETVTVPVDWDDPSKGRRELDASKGERVLCEDDMTALLRKVRERLANEKPLNTDQWAEVVTQAVLDSHFAVTLHEPKNGECPGNVIPPMPEGVHPHTWEMAHDANTQAARDYWTRKATQEEVAYHEHQEAMEESRKAVELDTPPF